MQQMFPTEISLKVLNVEKLEKKFASLTKSRESIQGLSIWIIRHKEFYKEIVNQWFDALTRDLNALTMFYVANDVIQNCGRKKAPEYREAFAPVLEKAVALEKVKEIKKEVIRMLTLWNERAIYDDVFFKKLLEKLNAVEEPEIDIEEELPEAEVIANYKLENLIKSLKELKTLEEELLEKEEFLEDIEEPGMSNIDNLIVKMESQKELQKFDKFQKLVEDYISLSDKVLRARKATLLNLKYSAIFYNAQCEDAKKVAHAYRIYGKKIKTVEKSLSEKSVILQEQSPVFSENSLCMELNSSGQESESSNISGTLEKNKSCKGNMTEPAVSPSTKVTENENNVSAPEISSKSLPNEMRCSPVDVHDSPKSFSDKEETPGPSSITDYAKSPSVENALKCSSVLDALINITSENVLKSPAVEKHLKSPTSVQTMKSANKDEKIVKKPLSDKTEDNLFDDQEACQPSAENLVKDNSFLKPKDVLPSLKVEESDSSKTSNTELSDTESIDFLLEKSYDEKKVKSKASIKRKIGNLLKMKQSKACKMSSDDDGVHDGKDIIATESLEQEMDTALCLIAPEASSESSAPQVMMKTETITEANSSIDAMKTKISDPEKDENSKIEQTAGITHDVEMPNSDPIKMASFGFQTLSDIPTALLKNILDISRINMNLSLNSTSNQGKDPVDTGPTCSQTSDAFSLPLNDETILQNSETCFEKNVEKSHSKLGNLNDQSETDIQVENKISDSLKLDNRDDKDVCFEVLTKDIQDNASENIKKIVSMADSCIDNTQKTHSVKSTELLENLQTVLQCFTRKQKDFTGLNYLKTLNTLPSMPLENTLNVYNCIMQCYNTENSLNNKPLISNSNDITCKSSESMLTNEKFYSAVTHKNFNFQENMSSQNKESGFAIKSDSLCNENLSSKKDNLEIIDMEVDSDDESTT